MGLFGLGRASYFFAKPWPCLVLLLPTFSRWPCLVLLCQTLAVSRTSFASFFALVVSRTSFPHPISRVSYFFAKPWPCLVVLLGLFGLGRASYFFAKPWPCLVLLLPTFSRWPCLVLLCQTLAVSRTSFASFFALVVSRTSFPHLGRVSYFFCRPFWLDPGSGIPSRAQKVKFLIKTFYATKWLSGTFWRKRREHDYVRAAMRNGQ